MSSKFYYKSNEESPVYIVEYDWSKLLDKDYFPFEHLPIFQKGTTEEDRILRKKIINAFVKSMSRHIRANINLQILKRVLKKNE